MKYKEFVSTEISNTTTYNSLDSLLNRWLKENKKIKICKIHYQLSGTNGKFCSSALVEYTVRDENEKSNSRE